MRLPRRTVHTVHSSQNRRPREFFLSPFFNRTPHTTDRLSPLTPWPRSEYVSLQNACGFARPDERCRSPLGRTRFSFPRFPLVPFDFHTVRGRADSRICHVHYMRTRSSRTCRNDGAARTWRRNAPSNRTRERQSSL